MIALPTLKQLAHLSALAEHRHFGKAARAVNVTQSTLSASVRELEDILQTVLVDRAGRGAALTPVGQEVVRRARQILEDANALVAAAQKAAEPLTGQLRLGVIPTIGPFLLPRLLGRLRQHFPKLSLYLKEDLTARLVEQLEQNSLDLLLIALPYSTGSLETFQLFEDEFYFCCPSTHPLAKQQNVSSRELATENLLLLQDGHCLRDHALAACNLLQTGNIDPFEATSLYTLVQMTENGLGVTLLPELALASGILKQTHLKTVPLAPPAPTRQIGLAFRRNTIRTEEFLLFGQTLKNLIEEKKRQPKA